MSLGALEKTLHQACGVVPRALLVVGFSGGPDSLALLHALHALGQPVLAAHLDHGLRPESASDADLANQLAAAFGVPFTSDRADVASHAAAHKQSTEEAARELRYRFLFRVAEERGAQAVAVAHNADDQTETVLMHLLRGAGPAGLRGMAARLLPNPWSAQLPLVRPLLFTRRLEILDYCAVHDLHSILDASNQDQTYFRNHLRHELLPLLESYAPGFGKRLNQTADLISADFALIEQIAEDAWRRCLSLSGSNHLRLDRAALRAEPFALQRAVIRRAFATLRPQTSDLDFPAVERALQAAFSPADTAPVDWLAGLFVMAEGQHLWIAAWEADLPVDWPQAPETPLHIETPADLQLGPGWIFTAEVAEFSGPDVKQSDHGFEAQLDLARTGEDLTLRRRKPGDRFQPLGLDGGSMKLSDFMINEKLPQRARETWPLVCKGDDIVWVPGYRLAHPYRLQPRSRKALRLRLLRSA